MFGLSRVNDAPKYLTEYLRYLFAPCAAVTPLFGELKRGVRGAFGDVLNAEIGNGTPPDREGRELTAGEAAELAYWMLALDRPIKDSILQRKWEPVFREWLSIVAEYNQRRGDIWSGLRNHALMRGGDSVVLFRVFVVVSGVSVGRLFNPDWQKGIDHFRVASSIGREIGMGMWKESGAIEPRTLDTVWLGLERETSNHYLPRGTFSKPSRKPRNAIDLARTLEAYYDGQMSGGYSSSEGISVQPEVAKHWYLLASGLTGVLCGVLGTWIPALVHVPFVCLNRTHQKWVRSPGWSPGVALAHAALCTILADRLQLGVAMLLPLVVFVANVWSSASVSQRR